METTSICLAAVVKFGRFYYVKCYDQEGKLIAKTDMMQRRGVEDFIKQCKQNLSFMYTWEDE